MEYLYLSGFVLSLFYSIKTIYPRVLKRNNDNKIYSFLTSLMWSIFWFIFVPFEIKDYIDEKKIKENDEN